jgi:diguanylate cyclase (GGDEF)-like protein
MQPITIGIAACLFGLVLTVAGVLLMRRAIANQRSLDDTMHRRAMHDPLTNLPNRALFMDTLERALHRARRNRSQLSVLFIDLDRFKEVNDTMGHRAGDLLLMEVAQRLRSCVRQGDLVARLSGDEFVVLIEEHGGPEELMIVGQKILEAVRRPVTVDFRETSVSASVGIASFPDDGASARALLDSADTAMYRAKEFDRNCFRFYSTELNEATQVRLELEGRLREALVRDEFFLEYLPEFDPASGRIVAAEILPRWNDSVEGLLLPAQFAQLAEEAGLMGTILAWSLDRALGDLRSWQGAGIDVKLAINIPWRVFMQGDMALQVARMLSRHGMGAEHLRIEITEPNALQDADAAHRSVRDFRNLGVEVQVVSAMARALGLRVVARDAASMKGYVGAGPTDAAGIAAMTRAAAAQTRFA